MNFGWAVVLRAALFAAAIGLAWIGLGFLAFAGYSALVPGAGVAGAALVIALVCIAVGAIVVSVMFARAPHVAVQHPMPVESTVVEGDGMIKTLTDLAQDHPLLAVCCAAILGATNGSDRVRARR